MTALLRLEGLHDTGALGAALAETLEAGDVVLLSGELGAGKTALTKALVAALGGSDEVTSPTFTLCHLYATRPPLAHVDCWRLERTEEIVELGLEEVLDEGGALIIEWGERAEALFGSEALMVSLAAPADGEESTRTALIEAHGARWSAALEGLLERARRRGIAIDEVAEADAR